MKIFRFGLLCEILPFYGYPNNWFKFMTQTNRKLRQIWKDNIDAFRELCKPYTHPKMKGKSNVLPVNNTTVRGMLDDVLVNYDLFLFDMHPEDEYKFTKQCKQLYKTLLKYITSKREIVIWKHDQGDSNMYHMISRKKEFGRK